MTALSPANRWLENNYYSIFEHRNSSWILFRREIFNRVLSRTMDIRVQRRSIGGHEIYTNYSSNFDFVESYEDISTQSSFIDAIDESPDTLGSYGFYDGIYGYPKIELRHPWIVNAGGLRIYISGYWRSAHFNRHTNNPRLQELTDSN